MASRWVWTDPVAGTTWTMPINPLSGGSPTRKRRLGSHQPTAPNARPVVFEGEREPQRSTVDGRVLTEAHYNALEEWWAKRYFVQVVDDEGRTFQVYIKRLNWRPLRSMTHPWKHDVTVDYVVVGGSGI